MRKRTLLICAGGVLLFCVLGFVAWLQSDPSHKGKSLYQLASLAANREIGALQIPEENAREAILAVQDAHEAILEMRALGPKGDRYLIRTLQTRETTWRTNYQRFYRSAIGRPFRRYLSYPNSPLSLRQMAVRAIGNVGRMTPEIERALLGACQDSDVIVRMDAVLVLGYRGSSSPEVRRAVEAAMKDPQVSERVGMGPRGMGFVFDFDPKSVEEMIEGLKRPLPSLRYESAYALRKLGPKAAPATSALVHSLTDAELPVRIASVRALGAIGSAASDALPALEKLRNEEDSTLARRAIEEAIQQIQSPKGH